MVTKWALKALRTRARRDYILAAIFVLIFPLLALSFIWLQALILFALLLIAAWQTVSWEYWKAIIT